MLVNMDIFNLICVGNNVSGSLSSNSFLIMSFQAPGSVFILLGYYLIE